MKYEIGFFLEFVFNLEDFGFFLEEDYREFMLCYRLFDINRLFYF